MMKPGRQSRRSSSVPAAAPPFVVLSWESWDRHRWATGLAVVGLGIATALALFGLPPVDLHPPEHRLGIMDPLCGGTRAARYTIQGRFAEAWRYNPLGIAAVAAAVIAVGRAVPGLLMGHWATVAFHWTPRRRRVAIGIALVLIAALEVRQQLSADLLIAGT